MPEKANKIYGTRKKRYDRQRLVFLMCLNTHELVFVTAMSIKDKFTKCLLEDKKAGLGENKNK